MDEEKIINSTCGMCFAACGVRIHIAGGRVVKGKGGPDSPETGSLNLKGGALQGL